MPGGASPQAPPVGETTVVQKNCTQGSCKEHLTIQLDPVSLAHETRLDSLSAWNRDNRYISDALAGLSSERS
jgi:hypothetical protein